MKAFAVFLELLCPGLGHAALGFRWRAAAWLFVTLAAVLATMASVWALAAAIALRIASVVHAIRSDRSATPAGKRVVAALGCLVVAAGASAAIAMFVLEAARVPSASMAPTIGAGDHVLIDKLAYRLVDPTPGDIVVFDNPCQPGTAHIKRIVALAGDTVEIRCDALFVDGAAVAAERRTGACALIDVDDGASLESECSAYTETLAGRRYEVLELASGRADERGEVGMRDFPGDDFAVCATAGDGGRPDPGQLVDTAKTFGGTCATRRHYVVPPGHVFVLGDNRPNSVDSRSLGAIPVERLAGRVIGVVWPGPPARPDPARVGDVD